MKTTSRIILVLSLLASTSSVLAQTIVVRGRVSDVYNVGMPGVEVVVQGTSRRTVTELDGVYQIEVAGNEILLFSCSGFISSSSRTEGHSRLDVVILHESCSYLQDAVSSGSSLDAASSRRSLVTVSDRLTYKEEIDRINHHIAMKWSSYSTLGARP